MAGAQSLLDGFDGRREGDVTGWGFHGDPFSSRTQSASGRAETMPTGSIRSGPFIQRVYANIAFPGLIETSLRDRDISLITKYRGIHE